VAIVPDGRFPLASVRKVVTLGGYAAAVESGVCDPGEPVALADVERWYWPGTDGGAHQRARDWWVERGTFQPEREGTVRLREVALAMICFSDNAAADYLLDRIGEERTTAFAQRMGLATQDPILPALGEFRAWHRTPDRWLTMSPMERARTASELAATEPCELDTAALDDTMVRARRGRAPAGWGPASAPRRFAGGSRWRHAGLPLLRRSGRGRRRQARDDGQSKAPGRRSVHRLPGVGTERTFDESATAASPR
jgi:beta-lactamase class A